jgi:hypothetical protein
METVTVIMASQALLKFGRYHLAALGRGAETKGLSEAFKPAVDQLASAKATREQAEDALLVPRAEARFAESDLEVVLRDLAAQSHMTDRQAGGDFVFKAIFPNTVDAEVRPRGAAQVTAATAVRDRLNTQPAAAPVKEQWLGKLDQAIARLSTALEARQAAEQAVGLARAVEDGARETFVSSYDSNMGAIRQMFPRNRVRQNLYFDQLRGGSDETEEETVVPEAPPAVAAKKQS